MAKHIRSLFLFLLIPGLAAVSPLLVYPAVTLRYGADGFAAVAVAQSVGLTAAVICELGWSVIGPQAIARGASASQTLRVSMASKLIALLFGLPVSALVASAIAPHDAPTVALVAASFSLSALSPAWVLTGQNRPGLILFSETVPRVLLNIIAAFSIWFGAPLLVLAGANLVAVAASLVVAGRFGNLEVLPSRRDISSAIPAIRQQMALTIGRAISTVYTTLLTALVAALAPASTALYAAADRVLRMGLAMLSGVPARLQSWLGAAPRQELRRRVLISLGLNAALGVLAAGVFLVAVEPAISILFAGKIGLTSEVAALGALVVLGVCTSRGLGLGLVALGRANVIAAANVSAAIVGVSVAFLAVRPMGAPGGMLAALFAELTGILVQAVAVWRASRRRG